MRNWFGTDGVRGRVGQAPITPDFVLRLGFHFGVLLHEQYKMPRAHGQTHGVLPRPTVLIGKDTRVSGYMLESALEAGFSAAGVDVLLVGPMPTPGVAYLTRALRLSAGVVISASHNPFDDNGIKFFNGQGNKLDDALELAIEERLTQDMACVDSRNLGRAKRLDDAAGRYIEFCKSTYPQGGSLHGLKIVVDCAHGAAYHIAPDVFHELGAQVVAFANQPNGYNINDGVGATHTKALADKVIAEQADLGIALDGDGDRVMMIDASGKVYDGDALLYLIVKGRLASNQPVEGVVGTLMTNYALEQAFAQQNIPFIRAKVGDRYVMEALLARGWTLGGENSGHVLCLDRHTTGDGLISSLQVLAYLSQSQQNLAQACADLVFFPQVLINLPLTVKGSAWQEGKTLAKESEQARKALSDKGLGRVLIRPSGTEAKLRVMVEAKELDLAQIWAQRLVDAVKKDERLK